LFWDRNGGIGFQYRSRRSVWSNGSGQHEVTFIDCVWNVMAHAQKPDFFFRRDGRVHLNRQGRQFSRQLAGELCTSACKVCTARASLCSAVMWRLLVTHSILLFPLHFSSRSSPCAITFQTQSACCSCARLLASGEVNGNTYSAKTTSLPSLHWVEFQSMLLFLLPLLFLHLWWAQLFVLLPYLASRPCCSTAKRRGDAQFVAFEAFQPMPQATFPYTRPSL
jgi:hypothetical protein